jgi:hypothetical protein
VQDDYFELGVFQSFHMGVDTSILDYPVVQITWRSYYEILAALENDTSVGINGTVTDGDVNEWYAVRHGWWFPFWITFSYVWGVVNVALCIYLLIGSECAKSLRIICLGLSLSSNLSTPSYLAGPSGNGIEGAKGFVLMQFDFCSSLTHSLAGYGPMLLFMYGSLDPFR